RASSSSVLNPHFVATLTRCAVPPGPSGSRSRLIKRDKRETACILVKGVEHHPKIVPLPDIVVFPGRPRFTDSTTKRTLLAFLESLIGQPARQFLQARL